MTRLYLLLLLTLLLLGCQQDSASLGSSGGTGQGGSLARFTIVGDYLYTLESDAIQWFKITGDGSLDQGGELQLNEGKETIFPLGDLLFLGATDGLSIYQIGVDGSPQLQSEIAHFQGCDPVVANDTYAYVTLRIETCGGFLRSSSSQDVLNIYEVSDINNPSPIAIYQMNDPRGLGLAGEVLFLCEGSNGLKVLDVADPREVATISRLTDVHANDVIVLEEMLLVIGPEKIVQYDYSDPAALVKLSEIGI